MFGVTRLFVNVHGLITNEVLFKPKEEGGLGSILVCAQTQTMARMFILWIALDGDLILQHILQKKIGDQIGDL